MTSFYKKAVEKVVAVVLVLWVVIAGILPAILPVSVKAEAPLMYEQTTLMKENTSIFGDSFKKVDTNAYFFQETVNLDFDIIDITFSNGVVETVIPVVSNPIDVIPDATPPVYTQSDKEFEWLKWLKLLIILIFIIVIIIVCWPLLQPLLALIGNIIVWLITAPFKAIGQAIKKRKEQKKNDKNG